MMSRPPIISTAAWDLLKLISGHANGGPPAPPADTEHADAYQLLLLYKLIERSRDQQAWIVSQLGEVTLYRHEEAGS